MGFLIDSNLWIAVERGKLSAADVHAITKQEPVFLSPVNLAEVRFGIELLPLLCGELLLFGEGVALLLNVVKLLEVPRLLLSERLRRLRNQRPFKNPSPFRLRRRSQFQWAPANHFLNPATSIKVSF